MKHTKNFMYAAADRDVRSAYAYAAKQRSNGLMPMGMDQYRAVRISINAIWRVP